MTKKQFRKAFAEEWKEFAVTEPEGAWEMLSSPRVMEALEAYMQKLGGKKRSKL